MRTAKVFSVVVVLCLAAPAMAAWVGDVPDLVFPNTSIPIGIGKVVIASTGFEYPSINDAQGWASDGDTLLMGPGLYQEWNNNSASSPASPPWIWTKSLSLIGSGSGADANTNTVWQGLRDANGTPIRSTFGTMQGQAALTFQDFRLTGSYGSLLHFSGAAAPNKHPGLTFNNMAFLDGGHAVTAGDGGWGDAIKMDEGFNSLVIQNSLFDGGPNNNTGGDMIGLRIGATGVLNDNGIVDGNIFTNLKAGLVFNGYKANNWKITNNMFSNISELAAFSLGNTGDVALGDRFNTYGTAGIVIYPRHNTTAGTEDAWVKDFVIMSNTFKDIGYLGDEANEPATTAWNDTLFHDAGIGVTLCSGTSAQNVWISHNTFVETAADGVMKRAVNIVASDSATYDMLAPQTRTGSYGFLKNFVVGDNTYTGLADKAVRAIQWDPNGMVAVSPQTVFPDVVVKSAGTANITGVTAYGDRNGDGKITGYDVSNNTLDLNNDTLINNADKVYMVQTLLHTKLGDFNLDGLVDGLDFLAWQSGFDNNPATSEHYGQGETTWDNNVDGLDFLAWQSAYPTFTNANYPASYGPVPEPATLALLVLGGLAALRRRR